MEIQGDILEADETYIVHQCNCRSSSAAGLASQIFERFPFADVYDDNQRTPGTIEIRKNIVAFYSQIYPGKAKRHHSNDSSRRRERMFQRCLDLFSAGLKEGESVAFPFKIGCGLARGNWDHYLLMIQDFAEKHPVTIYRLEEEE